ncbi:MAG: glycosyltransferase [Butyrivibrio sp.]|nr:glycosyltransferase [Muribaculum sp.]MCM1551438.1 glycosyltransferase [Butyrivibrio sp.]
MKKRILFVINTLGHAGAETALLELMRRLDPEKYEIYLYVLMGQGEMVRELPTYVELLNTKYDDSSVLSGEGKRRLQGKVLRALFSRGTFLRLAPYMTARLFEMLQKGRILPDKLLWRAMSDGGERFDMRFDLAVAYLEGGATYYVADHVDARRKAVFVHVDYERAGYTRALDRGCYLKYDRIFAVSDEVRKVFLGVYPECAEKTDVFHNILDAETIRHKAGGKEVPEYFADGYQGMRILSVGRLTAQKAFEVSIQAMKLLKERGEQVRWYVLGDGDQRRTLEEQVRRLGLEEDFVMPGAVDNPYPYMAQADLYVHASRFEGKSIAIQEAQILGKAILVSDCSGNREQVTDGVDGRMCKLTPEGICEGVIELLHDPEKRERFGRAAAEKNADSEAELAKLLSVMARMGD